MATVTDTGILNSLRRDCERRDAAVLMAARALMATGEMMWSIPEYHDEQAFPLNANGFGPVALFFASPFLGGFKEVWQVEEHGVRGMVAGVVVVMASSGTTLPAPYANLKLKGGVNCLWLAFVGGNWTSYISQPKLDKACSDNDPRDTLAVVTVQHPMHVREADYPPVVRFGEEGDPLTGGLPPNPGQGQPLLGVRCVNHWCEIGPRNAAGNPAFAVSKRVTPSTGKEDRIKGWYDEQWIAIDDGTGKLKPAFRAAIFPVPNINTRPASFFQGAAFKPVARILLDADPPPGTKYAKMGFRSGSNVLAIRHHTNGWEAQLMSSGGVFSPLKLFDRVQHFDVVVPGTARFRWNVKDDGAWAPCGQACCRIASIE